MQPDFDATMYCLGSLCKRGHDWNGTGQSLRYERGGQHHCVECRKAETRARYRKPVVVVDQPEIPDFDQSMYYLGELCGAGHQWKETGRCLRIKRNKRCDQCYRMAKRRCERKAMRWKSRYRANREQICTELRERRHIKRELYLALNHEAIKKRAHDSAKKRIEYRKLWVARNRERLRASWRRRRAENPEFRVHDNISCRVRICLAGKKQRCTWQSLVGYTRQALMAHLEKQFTPEMTWENYGPYWHIDHIIPLSAFACAGPDDPLVKKAWALSNLRPLEGKANISKGNKLVLRHPN